MSDPDDASVRLAVVVDGPQPPVWVGELLRAAASSGDVDLVAVLIAPDRAGNGIAVDLYGRLDRRLFADDDPFRPWPHELPAAPAIHLEDSAAMEALGSTAPDVVLHLGDGPPPAVLVGRPELEVWWFERGGEPPYLSDLARGIPVSTTSLEARRGGGPPTTLGRWVTRAEPGSWHRTQAHAYRQSTELVLASLRKRTAGYPTAPQSPAERVPLRSLRLPAIPARAVRRRIEWQRRRSQWVLAVRPAASPAGYPTDTAGFTLIEPPPDRSWADPFLVTDDTGQRYVFFEDQPHATMTGSIACATIGPEGLLGPPRTVLERDYHLSYPFVFREDDEWFLLPESSANRTVELFRATRFPTDWELERVLLEDAYVVDATPVRHDGLTWIFASVETSTGYPTDAVSLFWAESLTAEWHPHPLNPVVTDVRSSRPGGRVIASDGRLVRPAQDGSRGYGCGLAFQEITRLTTREYEERPRGRISFERLPGSIGTHHFDGDGALEVVDVQRLIRRRSR